MTFCAQTCVHTSTWPQILFLMFLPSFVVHQYKFNLQNACVFVYKSLLYILCAKTKFDPDYFLGKIKFTIYDSSILKLTPNFPDELAVRCVRLDAGGATRAN